MKLSDTQKKWTLTATLATVLSFNLVISMGDKNFGTVNLASRSIAEATEPKFINKLPTKDGIRRVMLERKGDNQTVASISDPGSDCTSCGVRITLDTDFATNTDDIAVLLIKALDKQSTKSSDEEIETAKAEKVPATRKEREALRQRSNDEEDKEEIDEGKAALAKLSKDCNNRKRYKKSNDRLECFSDGLVNLLSNDEIEYDKASVFRVFAGDIAKPLMEMMKSTPGSERYDLAKAIINDLASSIPEDYNYLRQSLAKINAKIVADAERNVQVGFNEYKKLDQAAKANPTNLALRQQANNMAAAINQKQGQAEQLAHDLGSNLQSGFGDAIDNQYLNRDLANQYLTVDYAGTVNSIIQGLKSSTMSYLAGNTSAGEYQIPVIDIGNGSAITLSDGSTLIVTSVGTPVNQTQVITTTPNGYRIQNNGLTQQNSVLQGTTPMIQLGNNGQNTARIVIVPATGPQSVVPTRTQPMAPQIRR